MVRPYIELWPDTFTFEAYVHIIDNTKIVRWYINSIITVDDHHGARRVDGRGLRLRHLAAPLPRPQPAVVA